MARYLGAKHKFCKKYGIPLCGSSNCPVLKSAKKDRRPRSTFRKKASDYSGQLSEKQKAKVIYGVLEKQFKKYFEKAKKSTGETGEKLLQLLESRLDNVVYRLGFAKTRSLARQLVSHGHILVNDGKVTIPSYQVKPDDIILLAAHSLKIPVVEESLKLVKNEQIPDWLKRTGPAGKIIRIPARSEIGEPITEHLIIEYYSR